MAATAEVLQNRNDEYDRLGGVALHGAGIEFSELGVNDYATHLDQYLRHGEAALEFIEEDLITDSAERMVKAKYINEVKFRLAGDDFLSVKGNFSMRKITSNAENRMLANSDDRQQQKRVAIESKEPDKLIDWFSSATTNEVFVVDSLPVADDEVYAVKRLYRKLEDGSLSMHVVILHTPSVEVFNDYHQAIGTDIPPSINALGILENNYTLKIPEGISMDEFIHKDVDAYDETLAKHNAGQEFVFGIPAEKTKEIPNSNDVIRRQKPLLNIYKSAIRALGQSDWKVTPEVSAINTNLELGLNLAEGQKMSSDGSRALLDGVHQYIMSTLNNAPDETLDMLAALDEVDSSAAYGVASYYGGEAKAAGMRYESSACPTALNINSNTEQAGMEKGFRKDPTKCVLCPGCKNIVDLPKDLYKKNILHCTECKLTVKNGKVISHRELFEGAKDKVVSAFEIISDWFRKDSQERQIKKMAERQAKLELSGDITYLDKKRYEKQARLVLEEQAA